MMRITKGNDQIQAETHSRNCVWVGYMIPKAAQNLCRYSTGPMVTPKLIIAEKQQRAAEHGGVCIRGKGVVIKVNNDVGR
jgi:uncharacterized Fe-S cluster protein YjdI